jgi:hypothetical protein
MLRLEIRPVKQQLADGFFVSSLAGVGWFWAASRCSRAQLRAQSKRATLAQRCRASSPIALAVVFLAGCISPGAQLGAGTRAEQGAFLFQTWIGHAPATEKERTDSDECYRVAIPKDFTTGEKVAVAVIGWPAAAATGGMDPQWLPRWKACVRERGYQLDEYTLLPSGEWVKR